MSQESIPQPDLIYMETKTSLYIFLKTNVDISIIVYCKLGSFIKHLIDPLQTTSESGKHVKNPNEPTKKPHTHKTHGNPTKTSHTQRKIGKTLILKCYSRNNFC